MKRLEQPCPTCGAPGAMAALLCEKSDELEALLKAATIEVLHIEPQQDGTYRAVIALQGQREQIIVQLQPETRAILANHMPGAGLVRVRPSDVPNITRQAQAGGKLVIP